MALERHTRAALATAANLSLGAYLLYVVAVAVLVGPVLMDHHAIAPPPGGWPPFKWLSGCGHHHGAGRNPLCLVGWRDSCAAHNYTADGLCVERNRLTAPLLFAQGLLVFLAGTMLYLPMLFDEELREPSALARRCALAVLGTLLACLSMGALVQLCVAFAEAVQRRLSERRAK